MVPHISWMLLLLCWFGCSRALLLVPPGAIDTVLGGRIAVLKNWLPVEEVNALRKDAAALHDLGSFSTDALSSYGSNGKFDPTRDRQVLRLGPWMDPTLGDAATRRSFASRMAAVRAELSAGLARPALNGGAAVASPPFGFGSTEISYTRFGPGARLAKHVDEHHEELKGRSGWSKPTRRSVSWLVYLNEEWDAAKSGGMLRCYERVHRPAPPIGATPNGDLQLGWLRAVPSDPVDRPVYLDARRHSTSGKGNCALYALRGGEKAYLSKDFAAEPLLFIAVGDALVQKVLLQEGSPEVAGRFHFIEPPKAKSSELLALLEKPDSGYLVKDVPPEGGTLVLFDSVTLPHEVMPTVDRERFACSGWFHEDQQPEHRSMDA